MSESDFFQDGEDSVSEPRAVATGTNGTAPRAMDDPVVRRLLFIGAGLLILWLSVIISALVFGLLGTSGVPRTSTERALRVYEQAIDSTEGVDPLVWADYARTLTTAKQYSRAESVINSALRSAKSNRSAVTLELARLDVAKGDYSKALDAVKQTQSLIVEETAAAQAVLDARALITKPPDPRAKKEVLIIKADALLGQGDETGAIAAYDEHLKAYPTSADVYVMRGDLKAAAGDTAGAEKDYRECLRYIPDYQPALDGLDKIGAAR